MFILLIPNLYFFFINGNLHFFIFSLITLIYLFSILKTTKYLFILFPLFFLVPLYVYYISIYGVPISEQILAIVLETDFQEAWNFIGYQIYFYIFIFLICCVGCIFVLYRNYKCPWIWSHRSRTWVFWAITLYFLIAIVANAQLVTELEENLSDEQNNFLINEKNDFLQELKNTYPLGLFISVYDLIKEQEKINKAFDGNQKFTFNAKMSRNEDKNIKKVYILVIGETSRRNNWQLNGYERQTNPLLSQQKNLVNFSNMLSISSATRSSIPMMLTRKPAEQVYQFVFSEKSIISAYKEAGFKTYWLSTQQKFGPHDTSTSVFAKEADSITFMNTANYLDQGGVDSILIPSLEKIIKKSEMKQFIVIHTLGSHYNYAYRYPKEYNIYKPSLNNLEKYSLQSKKFKNELINSYDNSILFTDYVLNGFIEILKKQQNTESFLLYSSDHGEDLFDNNCEKSGHGLATQFNFEIASFAWYSDKFKENYGEKVENLFQNHDRKLNQTAIFPTLIDASNIEIPADKLDRSILKKYKAYPRIVMGKEDYDQASFDGVCNEIQ